MTRDKQVLLVVEWDKDDVRVEAYGTVDEVNCFVGQAVTQLEPELFQDIRDDLEKIQHELFDL